MPKKDDHSDAPVEILKKRFEESKEARQVYEKNWDKARDYLDNRQWASGSKIAWYQSEPVYNKCFEFVQIMSGFLSDSKWGVEAVPAATPDNESDEGILDHATKVNSLLDFLWHDTRAQSKLAQVLQYVFAYGTGFLKVTHDPEDIGDGGIGQIETQAVSPWYIFPDPDAADMHDASFVIEYHPVSLRWIIERYPEKYAELKEQGFEQSDSEFTERRGEGARGPRSASEGQRVDVFECWYRDSTIIEDEDNEDDVKMKYPNGRRTLMTKGGVVLEDGECLYSMWPYVRFIEIPRPAEFFGDCTLHKAFGIQDTINRLLREIIDNGMWLVHGIWMADSTSGVTPQTLAGYGPRAVVVKNVGTEVRRETGDALPGHIFETLGQQVEAFDIVVGLPNVLRGIVPSRQPVQTVMLQQESAEVRTRERQRRVEESLADLGKLWIDIVAHHWNDKRVIRNRKASGGFDMFQMSKSDFESWRYDIHIVPGSTAPIDRRTTLTMLTEAANQLGLPIPPKFVARTLGIPGLEQAMLEQEQMMAAEEEAMMQEQQAMMEQQAQAPMPEEQMPGEAPIDPALMEMLMAQGIPYEGEPQVPGAEELTPEEMAMLEMEGIGPLP